MILILLCGKYLFQKRVYNKWKIFKIVDFIPFMLFLSELVEVVFGIIFENFISNFIYIDLIETNNSNS